MLSRREAIKTVIGAAVAAGATASPTTAARAEPPQPDEKKSVTVTPVLTETLPEMEGKEVRLITVEYAPGAASEPHRHPGPVFVYVLDGAVVAQVDEEPAATYTRGQAWYEPSGSAHLVSRNASGAVPAKLLAFVISEKDQPVVLPLQT
jgi:quercetin dioxygenase-like cupin family protein